MQYSGVEIYQTPEEIKVLRACLKEIIGIDGELAEVGVYEGASAVIINEEIPNKKLYLFDTFAGFPDKLHTSDPQKYKVGDCAAEIQSVMKLLHHHPNVVISRGTFPQQTSSIVKDKKFAFVHIDVDIYMSTKESLSFFLPRMTRGGIILVHDYPAHNGVRLAVDEFEFKNKETIGGRQCIIRI